MTLIPNHFLSIEYYLSKFKILRILCIEFKIDIKEDRCIKFIISKNGSAYFVFVSAFYVTRYSLDSSEFL
jgi:hypothetical protein